MGFLPGTGVSTVDSLLYAVGRTRLFKAGISGAYFRSTGTGASASGGNTVGFSVSLNAGTVAASNGKFGYFDPTSSSITSGGSTIDYSKRIRFAMGGMMYIGSTNSVIRIVFSGTGNSTDAPFSNANGLTVKGFGVEFALVSSIIQARLIGFNTSYLTPTSYTTLTNGFGLAAADNRYFGLVLESDGLGNIYLYGAESSLNPDINVGSTPLLTLTGGPTNSTGSNRFGPEVQCANHGTVAPTSSLSALLISSSWLYDVQ